MITSFQVQQGKSRCTFEALHANSEDECAKGMLVPDTMKEYKKSLMPWVFTAQGFFVFMLFFSSSFARVDDQADCHFQVQGVWECYFVIFFDNALLHAE